MKNWVTIFLYLGCKVFTIINSHSDIAQLVEQLTVNQRVTGSSPVAGAKITLLFSGVIFFVI